MTVKLNPIETAMLWQAARSSTGIVSVKVADETGASGTVDRRLACAQALEKMGFLVPMHRSGHYAQWRLTKAACDALAVSGMRSGAG